MKPLIVGLAALVLALAAIPAGAQSNFSAPTPKIAIVDVQSILREATSAKSAREQMNQIAQREQAALAEEEKKLRARDQALQQERAVLTPEVFVQRQRALQNDIANLQRRSRGLRLALDEGLRRTLDQIQRVMLEELGTLAGELDFNLVMRRSQIVIARDEFDITQITLERLNKRLPSIELKIDRRNPAGGGN